MNMIIKVSDFGLSVSTGEKEYYRLSGDMGVKLPLRWMAPETFSDYIFSEKSDVVRKLFFKLIHYLRIIQCHRCNIVELWNNMLGDIHRRPSPLCWH